MRLLILGAFGRVGRWATTIATAGHSVSVVLRPASQFDSVDGAVVSRGDLTDPDFLESVVAGHDAVVSCVGLRRKSLSPFAKLLSPPDLTTRLASTLARAMDNQHVRRLIVLSAGGVGDSFPRLSWPV